MMRHSVEREYSGGAVNPLARIALTGMLAATVWAYIGYPVVLKPLAGYHGRGVSINLRTPDEVEMGFAKASEHGRTVIVESYIEGLDHRLVQRTLVFEFLAQQGIT